MRPLDPIWSLLIDLSAGFLQFVTEQFTPFPTLPMRKFSEVNSNDLRHNSIKVFHFFTPKQKRMVLNNIRAQVKPLLDSLGRALAKTGLAPNVWTVIGFLFAILAGILYAFRPSQSYLGGIAIIASGLFDVLDGAVARVTGKVTKAGSFNDSTLDRVAEVAIFAGILYGSYISAFLVLLALSFSLLVSYARAKGDSLSVTLAGVGVGERAERLVVLVVFSLIGYLWIGVLVVLILAAITFVQRYYAIMRGLSLHVN